MKSKNILLGILAITLIFTMMAVGCDDDTINDIVKKALSYTSTDSAGKTYILIITGEGSGNTGAKGDSYELTIKENGQPDKVSKGTITEAGANGALKLQPNNPGSETFDVTANSGQMTSITGNITVGEGEGQKVSAPGTVTPQGGSGNEVPPENRPVKDRWDKWVAADSTATLVYSVDNDGVCTITVGGTAQPNNATDDWGKWKARAHYDYTTKAGKAYGYTFEAWTQSGNRELTVQYHEDNDDKVYLNKTLQITNTRTTYTVYGETIPKSRIDFVGFLCADQLGTFYVKMLEIKETGSGGNGETKSFNSVADMKTWLDAQPTNTATTAYTIKLNVNNFGGFDSTARTAGSVGAALLANDSKYVNLDLSGSTITNIPNCAFNTDWPDYKGCETLTGIIIPNSVIYIHCAFENCKNLTSVTIPDSVTSIEVRAFDGTGWLNKQLDGLVYAGKVAYIYKGTMPENTSITLADGTKGIAFAAFNNCSGLTSVTIPDSVTSIGYGAFSNTAWLNNQPNGLVYAGKVAYIYKGTMPANTSITLLDGTKGIAGEAFKDKSNLTSITIPNSVTSIEAMAFSGCSGLTSITIPNSFTNIGPYAFYRSGLTSVVIPNSVTSIENNAFYSCTKLTSVTIPNSVTSIGLYAFSQCSELTSITIPSSVTRIENAVFSSSSLTSVTFQSTIAADNFGSTQYSPFSGDLKDKYLAGGKGTYTRSGAGTTDSPYVWTKQN